MKGEAEIDLSIQSRYNSFAARLFRRKDFCFQFGA